MRSARQQKGTVLGGRPLPAGQSHLTAALDPWDRGWAAASARHQRLAVLLCWVWCRPAPVLLGLAAVVGALVQPLAVHGDARVFALAGDQLLSGDGVNVFQAPYLQVGPTYLLLLGGIHVLTRALWLPFWPVLGAVQSVVVVRLALWSVARPPASLAAAWGVGLPVLAGGLLAEALLNGHPEELATGLLLILAARAASRGSSVLAPALVAFAVLSKLWGVLGVVVLLIGALDGGIRPLLVARRLALLTGLVVAGYGSFVLFGAFRTFEQVWMCDPYSPLGLLTGYSGPVPFGMRLFQVLLSAGVGVALVWRGVDPVLVVLGVVAARLLTDPLRQSYYWAELVLLVLVAAWSVPAWTADWRARASVVVLVPAACLLPYVLSDHAGGLLHLALLGLVLLAAARLPTTSLP